MDLGPARPPTRRSAPPLAETPGSSRCPTVAWSPPTATRPRSRVARETIRLAFVAALQHLPPRQRAVLILREVLRWQASEVAELLDTSVASVNSALQRARATLDASERRAPTHAARRRWSEADRELLARYVDAFERYDIDALIALLHEDATQSMPPYDLWLRGPRRHRHGGGSGRGSGARARG